MGYDPAVGYAPLNSIPFFTNGAHLLGHFGPAMVGTGYVQAGGTSRSDFLNAVSHGKTLGECQSVPKTRLGYTSAPEPLQQILEEPNSIGHQSAGYYSHIKGNTEAIMTNSGRSIGVDQ